MPDTTWGDKTTLGTDAASLNQLREHLRAATVDIVTAGSVRINNDQTRELIARRLVEALPGNAEERVTVEQQPDGVLRFHVLAHVHTYSVTFAKPEDWSDELWLKFQSDMQAAVTEQTTDTEDAHAR